MPTFAQRPCRSTTTPLQQVIASLLVSVFIVGVKLNSAKEIVQTIQRRSELKANLALLQRPLETEALDLWLSNIAYDAECRQNRIVAIESASRRQYSMLEAEVIEKGAGMFDAFEGSSAAVTQLVHSATIVRSEMKDTPSGFLGRAEAEVRCSALEVMAYGLNFCDSRVWGQVRATDDNTVRSEALAAQDHHTTTFTRVRAPGMSDRTFLNANVAKRIAEDPPTYLLAIQPIPKHEKIGRLDEARAVRGEVCRTFKCTELAPRRTKLEYVCSLALNGLIPKIIIQTIGIPQQLSGE
jgi:hypothetical protein